MLAEQGSADWFAARLGCATASSFKSVLAKLKTGKPGQARESYLIELVTERLTGQPVPHFTTAAMQWGTDNEPAARIEYEFRTERVVEETGFIRHPSILAGASPDGLVEADGGIEIKCPSSTTHVDTLIHGMPDEHMAQLQGAMWITGRAWWDFVSYDPRMPKNLQIYIQRIERNDIFIAGLDTEVRSFLAEVDSTVDQLTRRTAA
jgi:hypothetical protein